MPDGKKDKATLWKVYRAAVKARDAGYGYNDINKYIHDKTGIPGIASLEKALDIPVESSISAKNLARSAYQGATFGWGDEIAGAVAQVVPGGHDYESMRAELNTREQQFQRDHPVASLGANIVGGAIIPGLGGAGAMRAVGGGVARRALAGGVVGGLLGAGAGAVEGAGRAEPGQRLEGAWTGATGGGLLGGAIGAAGPIVGPPLRKAAGAVTDRFRGAGANTIARREVLGALEDAQIRPSQFEDAYSALPPGSMPADVDPALAERVRAASNISPRVNRQGGPVERVVERARGQGERMADDLRAATRLRSGFDIEDISKRAKEEVREIYFRPLEQANNPASHPLWPELLANDDMKRILRSRGITPGENGELTFTEVQSILGRLRAKMTGQKDPDLYRRYSDLYRAFRDTAEEAIEDFRVANLAYEHALARGRAWELGQDAFRLSSADLRKAFDQMPTEEAKEAFRQGMLDKIERSLREREGGGAMARRLLGMENASEMLERGRLLFDSEEEFARYLNSLEAMRRWKITSNIIRGNSTTARQIAGMAQSDMAPSRQQLLWEILTMAFDDRETRMQAADVVADVLTTQGEDAARKLAHIIARGGRGAGAAMAVGGTTAGRLGAGLLAPEEEQPTFIAP